MALSTAAAAAKISSQTDLFGGAREQQRQLVLPEVDDWAPIEKLKAEFEALGFYLSSHPLDDYRSVLDRAKVTMSAEFLEKLDDSERGARLAGSIVSKRDMRSQKGSPYAFVTLTDQSGEFDVTLFSEQLSAHRELLEPGRLVVLNVTGRRDKDRLRLTAQSLQPIEQLAENAAFGLRIFVNEARPLETILQRLSQAGPGRGQVNLVMQMEEGRREVELRLPGAYSVGPRTRGVVKAIAGVVEVLEA